MVPIGSSLPSFSSLKFRLGNDEVAVAKQYVYLGVTFQYNRYFSEARDAMLKKGGRCVFSLIDKVVNYDLDFDTAMNVFNRAALPVLLYGAEFWLMPSFKSKTLDDASKEFRLESYFRDSSIERVQYRFVKAVLGVNKFASIEAILGETGIFPLFIRAFRQAINFWIHAQSADPDSLVNKALIVDTLLANDGKETWGFGIKSVLDYYGLSNLWTSSFGPDDSKWVCELFVSKAEAKFSRFWSNQLHTSELAGGKLSFYAKIKNSHKKETYLSLPFKVRRVIARFRMSNHKLCIETGRYTKPKTPREERFCSHCPLKVLEDEPHFLLSCQYYRYERGEFFKRIHEYIRIPERVSQVERFQLIKDILNSNEPVVLTALGKFLGLACDRAEDKILGWAYNDS